MCTNSLLCSSCVVHICSQLFRIMFLSIFGGLGPGSGRIMADGTGLIPRAWSWAPAMHLGLGLDVGLGLWSRPNGVSEYQALRFNYFVFNNKKTCLTIKKACLTIKSCV